MCDEQNIFILEKKNLIYFENDDITHSRLGKENKLCRQQIVRG